MTNSTVDRLLRRAEVEEMTGLGRSAIYRNMRAGQFPLPLKLSPRAVRWRESEISDYLAALPRATGDGGK